ncbi:adenylate cyclase [Leptolyngbya sp. Heron Island J]|uniref:CHASE2 domain-containing protein n=1 Tax=Leptolyngbya sp. Heron Island J TaxID=1385935 RepID=UPI0003B96E97|nr:adenylate/guanylate cyclase domain-containing protein [Leptolyngbya sp. Heron Island J]ESA35794.1 adenylate cyclase [Leptolyngbya sp. Heron Island J]
MFLGPGLAAAGLGVSLFGLGVWEPLEQMVYTGLFLTRDRLDALEWDDRIVVIAIDNASLETYGPYPWPRDRYANLLDHLMAAQPAAIGFDILMPETTANDAQLAESIRFSNNVVLAVGGDGQGNSIQVTSTLTTPAQGFFDLGHVKHTPDLDGLSRQSFLYERYQASLAPSFAIALLDVYQRTITNLLTDTPLALSTQSARFLEQPEQFDQSRPILINWPGLTRPDHNKTVSPQGLTTLSFGEVLNNDALLDQLQNKILLVGYTATGVIGSVQDPIRTPFEQDIPTSGVYLHAAILDNLLNDRFLSRLPNSWTLGLIILSALGSSLVLQPIGLRGRLIFMIALIPAWFLVTYLGFIAGLWLPMAAPIGTTLLGMMFLQVAEQRERQALTDLFAISLSPEMADFIWKHKDELLTQGQIHSQELTATLLFSDIRGFTTISETLPSEQLIFWLNRYFEVMTECIMAHGGVVDKYIGDAIMAAFGAPVSRSGEDAIQQDALAAVNASMAMVNRLKDLNQEFAAQGLPTVRFGIGLHTGPLVAGTVGSRHRANYSLFGDTVNIAARLQDMTKQLTKSSPYPILMSEATYQRVANHYDIIAEKARIQLRGRTAQTTVYALGELDNV